jgi:hypothetical protein
MIRGSGALAGLSLGALALGACHPRSPPPPVRVQPPTAISGAASPGWIEGDTAVEAAAQLPPGAPPAPADGGNAPEIRQERKVQQSLPMSVDLLWKVLRTTRISEDKRTGFFSAVHPPAVRALAGTTVSVTGFMLPIEQARQTSHFLVSRYTPVCFFCPPGDPNEVVEVRTRKPRPAGYDRVKVTGRFSLADNGEKGLFFRIEGD